MPAVVATPIGRPGQYSGRPQYVALGRAWQILSYAAMSTAGCGLSIASALEYERTTFFAASRMSIVTAPDAFAGR